MTRRAIYQAMAFDEKAGREIVVGTFSERYKAERAAIAKCLQPGFRKARVNDTEQP